MRKIGFVVAVLATLAIVSESQARGRGRRGGCCNNGSSYYTPASGYYAPASGYYDGNTYYEGSPAPVATQQMVPQTIYYQGRYYQLIPQNLPNANGKPQNFTPPPTKE
jgi:hypothetical protein